MSINLNYRQDKRSSILYSDTLQTEIDAEEEQCPVQSDTVVIFSTNCTLLCIAFSTALDADETYDAILH